jgi:hypothetical protein
MACRRGGADLGAAIPACGRPTSISVAGRRRRGYRSRMRIVSAALLLVVVLAANAHAGPGASWRKAGKSWQRSGSELFDAIGKSIANEPNKKQEWREVGHDFGDAGKNTAGAVGDTVTPDRSSGDSSKSK